MSFVPRVRGPAQEAQERTDRENFALAKRALAAHPKSPLAQLAAYRTEVAVLQHEIHRSAPPAAEATRRLRDDLVLRANRLEQLIREHASKTNAQRAAETEASLATLPWMNGVRARRLEPNGCTTCANAPARFEETVEGFVERRSAMDAEEARRRLAAKYPQYRLETKRFAIAIVDGDTLRSLCGEGAAACVRDFATPDPMVTLEADQTPSVVTHEVLHALTAPGWARRAPQTVNEAVTEYLTRREGHFPSHGGLARAYEGGQRLISEWVAEVPAREEALRRAYFTGDFSELERLEGSKWRFPAGVSHETLQGVARADYNGLDRRFATWDRLLRNERSGLVTVDDESLPPAAPLRDLGDFGLWGA